MEFESKKRSLWSGVAAFFTLILASILLLSLIGVFFGKRSHLGPDKIGLVRVEGIISDSRQVLKQLDKYRRNDTVKAILIRIDSPGGGVAPSQEIYEAVKKITARGKKKVVVSMGGVAASGGYYIACAADSIVANPGTITGSIGVLMEFANVEELLDKVGLKTVVMKTGPHKDIGSPTREMTPEDKAIIEDLLSDVYEQFVEAVAVGRGLETQEVEEIADGRIFTGRRALELGLVDELGGLSEAEEVAARMAGIVARPLVILEEEEEHPLTRLLKGVFNGESIFSRLKENGFSLQYRWP